LVKTNGDVARDPKIKEGLNVHKYFITFSHLEPLQLISGKSEVRTPAPATATSLSIELYVHGD